MVDHDNPSVDERARRGGELFQRIVENGSINERQASGIIKQLLSAIDYMHTANQIVHCDLNPDNILFKSRDSDEIKVIDFGMSKVLPRLQYLTHLCGTPYYTAPEVIRDKKYNHACDVWSVGVILFVCSRTRNRQHVFSDLYVR